MARRCNNGIVYKKGWSNTTILTNSIWANRYFPNDRILNLVFNISLWIISNSFGLVDRLTCIKMNFMAPINYVTFLLEMIIEEFRLLSFLRFLETLFMCPIKKGITVSSKKLGVISIYLSSLDQCEYT